MVGCFLIGVRLVGLRCLKSYKTKNLNLSQEKLNKRIKLLTFLITKSTEFSALAFSFVFFPVASYIVQKSCLFFHFYLIIINNYLADNFFITFIYLRNFITTLCPFFDLLAFTFTFSLCSFFRTLTLNLIEDLLNFLIEKICVFFVFTFSSINFYKNAKKK